MGRCILINSLILSAVLCHFAGAQLLDDDTLFIGDVSGQPGEQIFLDVTIKNSVDYAGWQIPIRFGNGNAPVVCDSVSLIGSIMTDTTFRPGGWDFIAPHVNNNEWNGVQTCGVAGIVWMTPPAQDLPPGDYEVMRLFFTISDTASTQTIPLDTVTTPWYDGGPPISYLVVVPPGYSRITHVAQGAIHIESGCAEDYKQKVKQSLLRVAPSIVRTGARILIAFTGAAAGGSTSISLYDASGRCVDRVYRGVLQDSEVLFQYVCPPVARGVYFIVAQEGGASYSRKIVVE